MQLTVRHLCGGVAERFTSMHVITTIILPGPSHQPVYAVQVAHTPVTAMDISHMHLIGRLEPRTFYCCFTPLHASLPTALDDVYNRDAMASRTSSASPFHKGSAYRTQMWRLSSNHVPPSLSSSDHGRKEDCSLQRDSVV